MSALRKTRRSPRLRSSMLPWRKHPLDEDGRLATFYLRIPGKGKAHVSIANNRYTYGNYYIAVTPEGLRPIDHARRSRNTNADFKRWLNQFDAKQFVRAVS